MTLRTGNSVAPISMRWAGKRLARDLAIESSEVTDPTKVTRADRLGRAAAGANENVTILNVFNKKNGMLGFRPPPSAVGPHRKAAGKGQRRRYGNQEAAYSLVYLVFSAPL